MESLGERLRWLRKARGWSVGQLAYRAGVSRDHIYKLENGQRQRAGQPILGKLARALNTTPDFLIGATDDPSPRDELGIPDYLDLPPSVMSLAERLARLPEADQTEILDAFEKILDVLEPEKAVEDVATATEDDEVYADAELAQLVWLLDQYPEDQRLELMRQISEDAQRYRASQSTGGAANPAGKRAAGQ